MKHTSNWASNSLLKLTIMKLLQGLQNLDKNYQNTSQNTQSVWRI